MRKTIKEHSAFFLFLLITAAVMAAAIIWVYHTKVLNAPKVYSDGFGYFVYLPAILHGDFSFGFVEGWEHPLTLTQVDGGLINKYPVGVAIMESPFFFMAHLAALFQDALTGGCSATGYSNVYQYAVLFGGVMYWMAGTVLLSRLLIRYLGISKKNACIACVLVTYGTNLFHYASYDACFSHIYSYAVLNLFLYYLCWYERREEEGVHKNNFAHTCVFGILAGIIFMIRNTNIVFVLTYILYGVKDFGTLKRRAITVLRPKRAVPIVLSGFVTIMPQLLYWHGQTGRWFVYSYGGNEPFYWLHPELFRFLFSVRKGLFFWSPLLLLAVVGVVCAYRNRDNLYIGLVSFLLVILYISSAWWCWPYGGSYGQRVMVDFMSVFAIFIACVLARMEGRRKNAAGTAWCRYLPEIMFYSYCSVCIVWNAICMLAYWYRILPSDYATWQHIRAIIEWL